MSEALPITAWGLKFQVGELYFSESGRDGQISNISCRFKLVVPADFGIKFRPFRGLGKLIVFP